MENWEGDNIRNVKKKTIKKRDIWGEWTAVTFP